jgi:hypothetical protein
MYCIKISILNFVWQDYPNSVAERKEALTFIFAGPHATLVGLVVQAWYSHKTVKYVKNTVIFILTVLNSSFGSKVVS